MSKIAVICAYNRVLNTGMLTVDLAFRALSARVPELGQVDFFNVEVEHAIGTPGEPTYIEYKRLVSREQLLPYDRIVFWGDFLHSRKYHQGNLRKRCESTFGGTDLDKLVEERVDLLLLKGATDEMLGKAVCFGGSLYINGPGDDKDDGYRKSVGTLYGKSRLTLLRDPISAQFATRYSEWEKADTLGVDAAFLLRPFRGCDWKSGATVPPKPRIGFSFGRGLSKDDESRRGMKRFASRLAQRAGGEKFDLNWLNLDKDLDPMEAVRRKLSDINSCSFIVTDTYHCAVNGWREGIPTFCIGLGAEHPRGTLSDKKKELLYSMFNLRDFYLFWENMGGEIPHEEIDRCVKLATNKQRVALATRDIRSCHENAERRLIRSLSPGNPI